MGSRLLKKSKAIQPLNPNQRMAPKNSVPGNALILTIIIALILAVICTSLILLAYFNRQQQVVAAIDQRLTRNLESATQLVLSDTLVQTAAQQDSFDLFGEQRDSISITKAPWGILQMAVITAFHNQFTRQKSFIYGSVLPAYMNGCLYMADHKRPLSLVGNTNLVGDAWLSPAGVKASYINQRGFDNDKLVDGTIKTSGTQLPPVNKELIDWLYELSAPQAGDSLQQLPSPGDSLVQRFADSTLVLYSSKPVNLDAVTLKGHIIIKSDSLIEAGAATLCEDVILVAPVIKFTRGFRGAVQAIATDSIITDRDCVFDYPSALVLLKRKNITWQNVMRIGEGSQVNGIIITRCDSADIYRSYAEIQKGVKVTGIAYIMGFLALSGATVSGTLLTDYFIYKTPSMLFENHLVDVVVNRPGLSRYFIGSAVFEQATRKEIIKWVQ
jgi:hypothetical protein